VLSPQASFLPLRLTIFFSLRKNQSGNITSWVPSFNVLHWACTVVKNEVCSGVCSMMEFDFRISFVLKREKAVLVFNLLLSIWLIIESFPAHVSAHFFGFDCRIASVIKPKMLYSEHCHTDSVDLKFQNFKIIFGKLWPLNLNLSIWNFV